MASEQTHYRVFLGFYLGLRGDHHGIYVETDVNTNPVEPSQQNRGQLFHSRGSLQTGMHLEVKPVICPLFSVSGKAVQQLGWVSRDNFRERIEEVCRGVPQPKKQFQLNKRLFPDEPLRHCQHWASDAVEALFHAGVLEPLGPSDNGEVVYREDI
ncbi:hypothetical protein C8A01DRAFT_18299 [Parachaetomium inaequale]|uniref:Uncharacterized protein n=1 Tax=Parachaetomium inaequale TaxID=2588326 RepID=A0AAN6PDZ3_9PEZI|nr:hypothetical protein C8A01DRAFT_18299 [Parachaetomium inaequale]